MRILVSDPNNKTAGFSLVEMLVVLAIIALVASIAAPGLARSYRSQNIDTIAREVAGRLRLSRTMAVGIAGRQTVVFDPSVNEIRFGEREPLRLPTDVRMMLITGDKTIADRQAVLTFLPNGSASGIEVQLRRNQQGVRIDVNWMTGLVSLDRLP